MKKITAIASLVALGLYGILLFVTIATPLRPCGRDISWMTPAHDFGLRMAEAKCLRSGVNPYDVWHGDIIMKPYIPFDTDLGHSLQGTEGFTECINAYVPWEYTLFMPLTFLPLRVAYATFFAIQALCLVILLAIGYSFAKRIELDRHGAYIATAGAILLTGISLGRDFESGNFAIVVLTATALMAVCLNNGRKILAGVFWAIAMIKPQLGLVFAIPLLMRKEFLTCAVAAALCIALSIPAALMCNASPLEMILQAPNAGIDSYYGSGTFPYSLFPFVSKNVAVHIGLSIGAIVCVLMTHMMSRHRNWLLYMLPAFITAPAWTYSLPYCHAFNWAFHLAVLCYLLKYPASKMAWGILAISLPFTTRIFNLVHFAGLMRPDLLPDCLSCLMDNYFELDPTITTISLFIGMLLCWSLSHQPHSSHSSEQLDRK